MASPRLSHQRDPDTSRMRREVERTQQRADVRLRDLEAFEAYVRDELYPYLVSLATVIPFSAPPRPPE